MKINIKQEGGFVGMSSKAKLDFNKLTEDEQKLLDSMAQKAADKLVEAEKAALKAAEEAATKVAEEIALKMATEAIGKNEEKSDETSDAQPRDIPSEADFVPPSPHRISPARDTFSYSLSMRKDGKKLDMAFDDTNVPPELVALFQKYIQI